MRNLEENELREIIALTIQRAIELKQYNKILVFKSKEYIADLLGHEAASIAMELNNKRQEFYMNIVEQRNNGKVYKASDLTEDALRNLVPNVTTWNIAKLFNTNIFKVKMSMKKYKISAESIRLAQLRIGLEQAFENLKTRDFMDEAAN